MRVLVTGGAGFIGSHLCDFLLARDCEVVCMDNLLTGSTDNIAHISDPRFLFVKHDVTNYIVVGGPLDYVLHFASPASPIDYLELPIQTVVRQALRNEPITVFGDGSQTRSFTYVSDLVEGIWALMQAPINEPVNIGNPREMTLLQLARQIIQMSGSRSEVVFRPLPTDDPKVRQPDITKARRVLGWEPKVEVEDGLRRTIDWCRKLVTQP